MTLTLPSNLLPGPKRGLSNVSTLFAILALESPNFSQRNMTEIKPEWADTVHCYYRYV